MSMEEHYTMSHRVKEQLNAFIIRHLITPACTVIGHPSMIHDA